MNITLDYTPRPSPSVSSHSRQGGRSEGSGASATPSSRKDKSSEPCNQWNRGSCSRHAEDCKYQHRCKRCGGDHPEPRCSSKAAPGGHTGNSTPIPAGKSGKGEGR